MKSHEFLTVPFMMKARARAHTHTHARNNIDTVTLIHRTSLRIDKTPGPHFRRPCAKISTQIINMPIRVSRELLRPS